MYVWADGPVSDRSRKYDPTAPKKPVLYVWAIRHPFNPAYIWGRYREACACPYASVMSDPNKRDNKYSIRKEI
jgi:hypothetical protein